MVRLQITTAKTEDQYGRPIELTYHLLSEYAGGLEQYGVEIVLCDGDGEARCAVPRISPLLHEVEALIRLLARNTVTPTSLPEILEDLLSGA